MKVALVCLLACFAIGAFAQIRPHISETFEGEGYSHITGQNGSIWGLGHWVIDEPKGHAIEYWEYTAEHRHRSVHLLKRFDLGWEYAIFWHHQTHRPECHKFAVKPPMPPVWEWLRESFYIGKHVRDGTTYDWWRAHHRGLDMEVAVSEHAASRPHYYMIQTPVEHRMYHFISFETFQPNATWFNVPEVCKNATESFGTVHEMIEARVAEAPLGSDDTISAVCAIAASNAARIVETSNGYDAASLIVSSFRQAAINTPSGLWALQAGGVECDAPRVGDVFFDGLPATSAAIYLGDDQFAECPAGMGGRCAIVPQRDFTGGCRRYC